MSSCSNFLDMLLTVGDSVLTSPMFSWGPMFSHFVGNAISDSWVPYEQV